MFKVIVAGGREFSDYNMLSQKLHNILLEKDLSQVEIVSGKAKGADSLGEKWGKINGCHIAEFPAQWDKYGKSAGYKRNEEMAKYADALIAFWDGESRGTKHMIDLAKRYELKIRVIMYED